MAGTLFVVATPIGNLEDISARALRILREVTVIAAEDTRRTAQLLARYGIATPLTSLHEHNEVSKGPALVRRLLAGDSVALVSDAGTPAISDPGAALVGATVEAGVPVEPIPGPSAVITAVSLAGVLAPGFQFIGFAPKSDSDRLRWMARLTGTDLITVFFESPHRILFTLEDIMRSIGDLEVVVTHELTKLNESLVRGQISSVVERIGTPIGEYTVVVLPRVGTALVVSDVSDETTPDSLMESFRSMTVNDGMTRRQAISALSRRHRLPAGEVYDRLERAKKSGG